MTLHAMTPQLSHWPPSPAMTPSHPPQSRLRLTRRDSAEHVNSRVIVHTFMRVYPPRLPMSTTHPKSYTSKIISTPFSSPTCKISHTYFSCNYVFSDSTTLRSDFPCRITIVMTLYLARQPYGRHCSSKSKPHTTQQSFFCLPPYEASHLHLKLLSHDRNILAHL